MKTCFKCGIEKPYRAFYRHPEMADGHLGKCKECAKHDVRSYWHEHAVVLRQTDRARRKMRQKTATNAVYSEIRAGRMARPTHCYYCNHDGALSAHHWNYYRPLDVTWLCSRCHAIADMARRDAEIKVTVNEVA